MIKSTLTTELINSNKTTKRRAIKHALIQYLENIGYDADDQGDHIMFIGNGFEIYHRPSHQSLDVYLDNGLNSTDSTTEILEAKLNKLYTNSMKTLGI
jgi:hypothetical protein